MGGVGDPQLSHGSPKPRRPGRSLAPSASPGEGEGPWEQKPRHPALASPGRGGLSRVSLCATEAPARLPGAARLSRRGLGRCWGRPGEAEGPFSSPSPSPARLANSVPGCEVLGEVGCAMQRAVAGGGEARALPSCASKEAFV